MTTQTIQVDYQEQQRLLRLNACDIWAAVGVTFAEFQAQKPAKVRCGLVKCGTCGNYYNPTYGACPECSTSQREAQR